MSDTSAPLAMPIVQRALDAANAGDTEVDQSAEDAFSADLVGLALGTG